jgi:hypothetical protein
MLDSTFGASELRLSNVHGAGGWGGVLNQSLHTRARSSHISALTPARTLIL